MQQTCKYQRSLTRQARWGNRLDEVTGRMRWWIRWDDRWDVTLWCHTMRYVYVAIIMQPVDSMWLRIQWVDGLTVINILLIHGTLSMTTAHLVSWNCLPLVHAGYHLESTKLALEASANRAAANPSQRHAYSKQTHIWSRRRLWPIAWWDEWESGGLSDMCI